MTSDLLSPLSVTHSLIFRDVILSVHHLTCNSVKPYYKYLNAMECLLIANNYNVFTISPSLCLCINIPCNIYHCHMTEENHVFRFDKKHL